MKNETLNAPVHAKVPSFPISPNLDDLKPYKTNPSEKVQISQGTPSTSPVSTSTPNINPAHNSYNTKPNDIAQRNRNTSTIQQRFGKEEAQFSGALDEFLSDYLRAYLTLCETLSISDERQLELLHTPLRGGALDYYHHHVKPVATSISHACKLLKQRYEGPERQSRIRQAMEGFRVEHFLPTCATPPNYRDWISALDKLVDKISSHTRQVAPQFQTDSYQVLTLQKAVITHDWSENPLRRMEENDQTVQKLHSCLGKEFQYLATRQASVTQKTGNNEFTIPVRHGDVRKLSKPRYGKLHDAPGRLLPSHKRISHSHGRKFRPNTGASQRPHIDPATGMNRADPRTGKPRRCKGCGSKYHFAFERHLCKPDRVVRSIHTRLVDTDPTEVLADLLEAYIEQDPCTEQDDDDTDANSNPTVIEARFGEILTRYAAQDSSEGESSHDLE